MSITREEIRQLCIAHDRFMAEQASEPIRSPHVQRNDAGGRLIYKRMGDALQSAPEPETEGELGLFGDYRDRLLSRAIGCVISHERHGRRQELEAALVSRDRKIGELEGEIRELKGMLGATLQLLGTGNAPKKLWTP